MSLKASLVRYMNAIKGTFRSPFNSQGNMLAFRNGDFVGVPTIKKVGFVETDEELSFQQTQKESFKTIFDTWHRITRITTVEINPNTGQPYNQTGSSYSDEGYPAELDAWTYDDVRDRIVCTVNSVSLAGFISNERYNNYTLEVQVSSTSPDNDFIGVCIAHAEDDQGRTHTLTAMRQLNGRAPLTIDKNFWAFDSTDRQSISEYEVALVYSGLKWPDGSVATGRAANSGVGWSSFSNGARIRITREDDIVTIETTQIGESTYFDPAKTVIDLAARSAQFHRYDPNTGVWEALPNARGAVREHTMTAIGNHLYVFGGDDANGYSNALWRFDITTDAWEHVTPVNLPPTKNRHAAGTYNGRLYIFGGNGGAYEEDRYNDLWEYNPEDNRWRQLFLKGSSGEPTSIPIRQVPAYTMVDGVFYFHGGNSIVNGVSTGFSNDFWKIE